MIHFLKVTRKRISLALSHGSSQLKHALTFEKGRLCSVEGRISTRDYEKDGRKVYVTEVIASNVRFLERADGQQQPAKQADPVFEDSKAMNYNPDDLPF